MCAAQVNLSTNGAVVGHQHCLSVHDDRRVAEGFQLHVHQLGLCTSWVLGSIESSRLPIIQAASASLNLVIFCEKIPKTLSHVYLTSYGIATEQIRLVSSGQNLQYR